MSRPRLSRIILIFLAVAVAAFLLVALASTDWLVSFGGKSAGARRARIEQSPNFRDGKFHNSVASNMLVPGSFFKMLRHQLFGDEVRVPAQPLAVVGRTPSDYATAPPSGLRATWIGHASTLVEIDGRRILFDPVFSERCSPSTLFGPRRFHPAPLALADLPPIDAVMISHDHFDHLDMVTATTLAGRGTHYVVPLGIGAHLEAWKIPAGQITELDWWQTTTTAGLSITSTPARHYSGRNPLRSDQALWSSWVVAGSAHKVYFSGDTGYFDGFAAIGAKHGPFDLTLIKIGASDPTWIDIHMSPEQAVQAHQDLGGKLLLPVHWGTFNLAFHAWNEPAQRAAAAAAKAGVAIAIPQPGQFVEPTAPPSWRRWWD
jgi:L-ascorbate metabolism protein UlaG (beta-lactamase superfamily)